jgi:H+-transporting ATPase
VYATGSETFFGRTALLINAVNDPGNFEKRLRQITLVITCTGVVLVVITFLYLVANQQPVCSRCC